MYDINNNIHLVYTKGDKKMDMNEIYIEKYVGEKEYSKFEGRWKFCRKAYGFGFNPFALLFGPLYLFYKKMYREGAAFLAVMVVVSAVVGTAAGVFAIGFDPKGFVMEERFFKKDFSYLELSPGEVYAALTAAPLDPDMGSDDFVRFYGDREISVQQKTDFMLFTMPLAYYSVSYFHINSLPAFVFWAARVITNLLICFVLSLRFDSLYYKKVSGLVEKQLQRIKPSASESKRQAIIKKFSGESHYHPLYILLGLLVMSVIYLLPMSSGGIIYMAVPLALFPIILAADNIFCETA